MAVVGLDLGRYIHMMLMIERARRYVRSGKVDVRICEQGAVDLVYSGWDET